MQLRLLIVVELELEPDGEVLLRITRANGLKRESAQTVSGLNLKNKPLYLQRIERRTKGRYVVRLLLEDTTRDSLVLKHTA
jgi:hypothetical protein